jgi:hypothetical protein
MGSDLESEYMQGRGLGSGDTQTVDPQISLRNRPNPKSSRIEKVAILRMMAAVPQLTPRAV